ncbi:MAG TPA: methyltransferase domain-containing protein [Spirosoma sp.]|nr:methyltransferase domain-containing protein [Spirosoma sp.]
MSGKSTTRQGFVGTSVRKTFAPNVPLTTHQQTRCPMTANNPFQRYDENDDADFYVQPRLVNHIDDKAIRATTELFRQYLPANSDILDLMSSWVSHLPTDVRYNRVAGLGMNETELRANPQLTEYVVQNLNQNSRLPYPDGSFDGGMVTVSVQYLTNPIAVYREVARVLRPGAPFITVFSNRMFPTKAVAIWQSLDDRGHQQLVRRYYEETGFFDQIEVLDCSPRSWSDPLYTVVGRRGVNTIATKGILSEQSV